MNYTTLFFYVLFVGCVGLDAMDQKTALVAAAGAASTNSRPKLTRTLSDSALHLGAISRAMVENDVVTCALKQLQEAKRVNAEQVCEIQKRDSKIQEREEKIKELAEELVAHQNALHKLQVEITTYQLQGFPLIPTCSELANSYV